MCGIQSGVGVDKSGNIPPAKKYKFWKQTYKKQRKPLHLRGCHLQNLVAFIILHLHYVVNRLDPSLLVSFNHLKKIA